jgi:hypothetical protein
MPPTMIRPPPSTMATTLKAKRRCCTSFFITDILGNQNRSPSPISTHNKNHLTSTIIKDTGSDDDDDTMLRDSDENGKRKYDLSKKFNNNSVVLIKIFR